MKFSHYQSSRNIGEIPWPERYLHFAVNNTWYKVHEALRQTGKYTLDISQFHGWVIAELIHLMEDKYELEVIIVGDNLSITIKTDT